MFNMGRAFWKATDMSKKDFAPSATAANVPAKDLRFRIPIAIVIILLFGRISFTSGGADAPGMAGGPAAPSGIEEYSRLAVAALAYFVGLFGLMRNPGVAFRVAWRLRTYIVFCLFAVVSALWSAFPEIALKFGGHTLGLLVVAIATAFVCAPDRRRLYVTVHVIAVVLLLASVVMVVAVPARGLMQIADLEHNYVGRWRGVTAHPNALGIIGVTAIWSGLACRVVLKHPLWRLCALLDIGFALAVLVIGARSMTSAIVSVMMIGLFWLFTKNRQFGRSRFPTIVVVMLTCVAVIVVLGGAAAALELIGRDMTLSGRTLLWDMAAHMIQMKPWVGWSFDESHSVLEFLGINMPYVEFHNGYIEILVRGGLLGFIIFVAVIVSFVRSTNRLRKIDPVSGTATLILLVAVLLQNVAESTFTYVMDQTWSLLICLWAMNEYQLLQVATVAPRPKFAKYPAQLASGT
jgi:O-antigen ligase